MKSKYPPEVYAALRNAGMRNREIAKHLGVSEAAVRRGLKSAPALTPGRRQFLVTVEEL